MLSAGVAGEERVGMGEAIRGLTGDLSGGGEHLTDISGLMCFSVMREEDRLELHDVWEDEGGKADDKDLVT